MPSASVKRADELVAGDWINYHGTAAKILRVEVNPMDGRIIVVLKGYHYTSYAPHALVEYVSDNEMEE